MKKFAILAGLMSLALVIGAAGMSFHHNTKVEANATDLIVFNPEVCAGLTHLTGDCLTLNDPESLAAVAAFFDGKVDDPATYKDLVDASAAQLGDSGEADPSNPAFPLPFVNQQDLWVLTFVSNDDKIQLTAEQGVWLSTGDLAADETTPKSTFTGCPLNDTGLADEDCNNSGSIGDGVVVDLLYSGKTLGGGTPPTPTPTPAPLAPAKLDRGAATLEAVQSTDADTQTLDYTVVGTPDNLTVKSLKTTIQEDSGAPCVLGGYSTNEFNQENALPDVSGALATVIDSDNTELTGIFVTWVTDDESDIHLSSDGGPNPLEALAANGTALGLTPTLFKSKQASAPELACGGDAETGVKIEAAVGIDDFNGHQLQRYDVNTLTSTTTLIDDNTKIDVLAKPGNLALAASPNPITCDGINSSTVTATLTDANGKPVVAGNQVKFDVVALGTASPILTTTDDKGLATSKVTPLSGVTAGVTADVTVRTNECVGANAQSSTPFDCFNVVTVDNSGAKLFGATTATFLAFDTSCLNPCKTEQNAELDNLEATVLVSCNPVPPTAAPPGAAPGGNVTPPKTGDGGYLP